MLRKGYLCFIISFMLLFTSNFYSSVTYNVLAADGTVISKGKPAKASSEDTGGGLTAGNANDGDLTTRWSANGAAMPQWWRVDLGDKSELAKVVIHWFNSAGRSYTYKIETSDDDITYTLAVDKSKNTELGDSSDLLSGSARYVKITIIGSSQEKAYASFLECEVYGGSQKQGTKTKNELTIPSDVKGTTYEKAVRTLLGLNILKVSADGTFKPEEHVTRAELAGVMVTLLGLQEVGDVPMKQIDFKDIKADDPTASCIQIVHEKGIISGYDDGSFKPEQPVTYEQAIKALVASMGFEIQAQKVGGYPLGYVSVAMEKGITRNVNETIGSTIKRGELAIMIYNSLDVDIMQMTSFTGNENGNSEYSITANQTLLTEKLDITKSEGQITGNSDTKLSDDSSLSKDEVEIDEKTYKKGSTNSDALLGYKVTYYYKTDKSTGDNILLYIEPREGKNDAITIIGDNIIDYSGYRYTYWADKKKDDAPKKADISSKADIIYNGRAISVYDDMKLKPVAGKVVLLDVDGDEKYDIVFVTSYSNYVVQSISGYTIYDKYDSNKELNLDEQNGRTRYSIKDEDGNEMALEDIKEWDVLSVMESNGMHSDETQYNIIVSHNSIEGKVSEISMSGSSAEEKICVGDKEYSVASNCYDSVSNDVFIGFEGTFYLDVEGKIAAIQRKSSEAQFAFVVAADISSTGINKRIKLKLFNQQGNFIIARCVEKIEINKVKRETDEVIPAIDSNGNIHKLVKYKLDANGEIESLDTAYTDSNSLNSSESLDSLRMISIGSTSFKSSSVSFSGLINLKATTIVFRVPADFTNEAKYSICKANYFADGISYKVDGYYNKIDSLQADAVILWDADGSTTAIDDNLTVVSYVTRITDSLNPEGVRVKNIYCYTNGKEVTYYTTPEVTRVFSDENIEIGDVIRYNLTPKNVIENIEKVFDVSEQKIYTSDPSTFLPKALAANTNVYNDSFSVKYRVLYGDVLLKDGSVVELNYLNSNVNKVCNFNLVNAKIYIYDSSKPQGKRISIGSTRDIIDKYHSKSHYSKMFIYNKDGAAISAMIVK